MRSDEEIVAESLAEPDAFLELMRRYEDKLLRYIARLIAVRKEDCEDVLQEVFIKAYQGLRAFDQDLKFSSWIYRIAHNEAISFWRKNKKRSEDLSIDEEVFEVAAAEELAEEVGKKIEGERIVKLLNMLEPKYRDVLVLKFFEGKDYSEISDILKKPMGTVATLMNRAKSKLKKIILKHE